MELTDLDLGHDAHTEIHPLVDIQKDCESKEQSREVRYDGAQTLVMILLILVFDYDYLLNEENGGCKCCELQVDEHERDDLVAVPYSLDHFDCYIEEYAKCDEADQCD